jgi:hypothetical protein
MPLPLPPTCLQRLPTLPALRLAVPSVAVPADARVCDDAGERAADFALQFDLRHYAAVRHHGVDVPDQRAAPALTFLVGAGDGLVVREPSGRLHDSVDSYICDRFARAPGLAALDAASRSSALKLLVNLHMSSRPTDAEGDAHWRMCFEEHGDQLGVDDAAEFASIITLQPLGRARALASTVGARLPEHRPGEAMVPECPSVIALRRMKAVEAMIERAGLHRRARRA